MASLLDALSLKSHLQAAATHAKAHRVQINTIRLSGQLGFATLVARVVAVLVQIFDERLRRILVHEYGQIDSDFGTASLSDILGQVAETWMTRIDGLIAKEQGTRDARTRRRGKAGPREVRTAEHRKRRER